MPFGSFAVMAFQPRNYMKLLAQLLYVSPTWWGVTSAREREQLEIIINHLKRCGFLPMLVPSASTLVSEADQRLFKAVIQNPSHVLRKLLPEVTQTNYDLRHRAHKFRLTVNLQAAKLFLVTSATKGGGATSPP